MQQEVISDNLTSIGQRNIHFQVEGKELGQGYISTKIVNNNNGKGLIIIQEWWGLNTNICNLTDSFAELGYIALAVDMYRGKIAKDREVIVNFLYNVKQAGHLKQGLDFENAILDINSAAIYLQSQYKCKKIGIIGYCMGGALVLATATRPTQISIKINDVLIDMIAAGVAYYGTPDATIFRPQDISIPVLGNFGLKDIAKGFSDPETVQLFNQKALDAQKNFKLIFYDAEHSFNNQDTSRYNEVAAKLALKNTLDFFDTYLNQ